MKQYVALFISLLAPAIGSGQFSHFWTNQSHQYLDRNEAGEVSSLLYQKNKDSLYYPEDPKRNYFGFGIVDPLLYSNVRLIYERRFDKSRIGLQVPLSIGYNKSTFDYSFLSIERANAWYSGLTLQFNFPRNRYPGLYAIGLGCRIGQYYDSYYHQHTGNLAIPTLYGSMINSHYFRIRLGNFHLISGLDIYIYEYELGRIWYPLDEVFPILRLDIMYGF